MKKFGFFFCFGLFVIHGICYGIDFKDLSFDVSCINGIAEISWSLSAGSETYQYMLEKSSDGKYFEEIATINRTTESDTISQFRFIDVNPYNITYYRLILTDTYGNREHYEVVYTACKEELIEFEFIGTINSNKNHRKSLILLFNSDGNKNYEMYLSNPRGQSVYSKKDISEKGLNVIEISPDEITNGKYILVLRQDEKSIIRRIKYKN